MLENTFSQPTVLARQMESFEMQISSDAAGPFSFQRNGCSHTKTICSEINQANHVLPICCVADARRFSFFIGNDQNSLH